MGKKTVILNAQGEPIILSNEEKHQASFLQNSIKNSLGFEIDVTTLSAVVKKVTEQKFFEIAPADFIPVRVGEGAFSSNLVTYRSFALGDDFETGLVNSGQNNARLASADAGVDSVTVDIKNWAKEISWNLFELQEASKSGNWDLVTAKEKARKKNWDLGIQKIAFLGIAGNSKVNGLYTQSGIHNNSTRITKKISSMTGTELKAFVAGVLDDYRVNCARTAWPTHFAIPESDYLGLAGPSDASFHLKSTLQVLEETFKIMTKNPNFQILPCAYGDSVSNGLSKQIYALYNSEEESLRMDIPVNYTSTLANSNDSYSFKNVAYGQFTGAQAYRPKELMYFSY